MANICNFIMRVCGEELKIKQFQMLLYNQDPEGYYIGALYYDTYMYDQDTDGKCFSGSCKWSVTSSMMEKYYEPGRQITLQEASEKLGLNIEVYSTETGVGFAEHIAIINGDVVTDESVNYSEIYTEDYESVEELNKENNTNYTQEQFEEGWLKVGGFDEEWTI